MAFTEEEMAIDEVLGYPKAYAKLCRSHAALKPYSQGPPSVFVPYTLPPQEALRAKDLNQMFPVLDPDAIPSVNPRGYVNILWKQLDHLGNAGFDPALFRVDVYGNVLYLRADSASPLAWDVDHWFPCSRGGKTVPSNIRILQWQVCRKKQNKLEFLIPWWDLQSGVSVNQFLSIFASKNLDLRNRAFSFWFSSGGSEEMNALQSIESHRFPQHFIEMKQKLGLAPAALVSSERGLDERVLNTMCINRFYSSQTDSRKFSSEDDEGFSMAVQCCRPYSSKENAKPDQGLRGSNPYLSIAMARDSLRQREEIKKRQREINELESEFHELKQKNETERTTLQELEALLIKKRRRVDKCRRLAEAQSSYRALLEKMIRDAMHRSVVYKEQLRLNQAATSALMARLEAQRAICDSSEQELHKRYKHRDEIEKQIKPCREPARKRSRSGGSTSFEEGHDEHFLLLTGTASPLKKELRKFLEEEHKASEAGVSLCEEDESKDTGSLESTEADAIFSLDYKSEEQKKIPATTRKGGENDESYCTTLDGKDGKSENEDSIIKKLHEGGEDPVKKEELLHDRLRGNRFSRTESKEYAARHIADDGKSLDDKLNKLAIERESDCNNNKSNISNEITLCPGPARAENDDEYRNQVGKGNVEKWLQMLLENARGSPSNQSPPRNPYHLERHTNDSSQQKNAAVPQNGSKSLRSKPMEGKAGFVPKHNEVDNLEKDCIESTKREAIEMVKMDKTDSHKTGAGSSSSAASEGIRSSRMSLDGRRREGRTRSASRCENSRGFMSFPSSPSVILSMRKGVDCMGKKPKVVGDDDDESKDYYNGDFGDSKHMKIRTQSYRKH